MACGTGEAKRLAAYVGCGDGSAYGHGRCGTFLASRLPRPMLPAAIMVSESLPRLACSKVDVSGLPHRVAAC